MTRETDAEALRSWATGLFPLGAAVELLADCYGGRLIEGRWIRRGEDGIWFDPTRTERGVVLSGSERRVLAIASSLAGGPPVALDEVLTGLDGPTLTTVLEALDHAGGGGRR